MNLKRLAALITLTFIVALPARAQQHFTSCISRTADNATLILPAAIAPSIGGAPMEAGDEIAVVTPDGTCAGVTVWSGSTTAISAWGYDQYSELGGFQHGDPIRFVVWDASADAEYQTVTVTYSSEKSYYRTDGLYAGGAIYEVASLTTVNAPQPEAPADGASVDPSSVVLEWAAVPNASAYVVQVATTNDFASLVVEAPGIEATSLTLDPVTPGSTYYWRVGTDTGGEVLYSDAWHFVASEVHEVALEPGWNLISSYVLPATSDLSELLAPLGSNVVLVKDEQAQVYLPGYDTDQIGQWDAERGYKVYVREADTLPVVGSLQAPASTPVALRAGWNLVGYVPTQEMETAAALAAVDEQLVLAKDIDGRVYYPQFGIADLGTLRPGKGYAVYARQATTLTYPDPVSGSFSETAVEAGAQLGKQASATSASATSAKALGYSAHVLVDAPELQDGDVVSAWAGDLFVGRGEVKDSTALILVRGDDPLTQDIVEGAEAGAPLSFKRGMSWGAPSLHAGAITDGLTGEQRGDVVFAEDALFEVALATATSAEAPELAGGFGLAKNYPNPFQQATTISYELDQPGEVRLEVFNVVGQQVQVLVAEWQPAGRYEVRFDAGALSSGTYLYRLNAGGQVATRRMVLLR